MTNTLPGTGYRVDLSPGIYSELWCSEYDTDDGSHEGHHAFALALEAAPRIGRSQRHRLTIASASTFHYFAIDENGALATCIEKLTYGDAQYDASARALLGALVRLRRAALNCVGGLSFREN